MHNLAFDYRVIYVSSLTCLLQIGSLTIHMEVAYRPERMGQWKEEILWIHT